MIYPQTTETPINGGVYEEFVEIDNVRLYSVNNCKLDIVYEGITDLPELTSVANIIIAKNGTEVLPGQDVTFKAENKILLQHGFKANLGSKFHAFIDVCSSTDKWSYNSNVVLQVDSSIEHEYTNSNTSPPGEYLFDDHINNSDSSNYGSNDTINNNYIYGNDLITIYPNPNKGIFILKIETEQISDFTIEIFDIIGRLIYQSKITIPQSEIKGSKTQLKIKQHKEEIDISSHSKGIYFVKVISGDEVFVDKIVYQ